jgi:carbon-monoxide dehydrogenase medium subunit
MNLWKSYRQPNSVEDALACLRDATGPIAVIAGGTDLLLDLQQGRHHPVDTLVDATEIEEMRELRVEQDSIFLGAAVTLSTILGSAELQGHATCLIEGCRLIGGPQVRNVATIGGNIAHALPAGDGTIALLALDAEAQIASEDERRWMPLEDLFAAPGKTTFDRDRELLVGIRIRLSDDYQASAFYRVMRPQRVAIAILNMAVWVQCTPGGRFEQVRLAVGPAGPRPFRARRTEQVMRGKGLDSDTLQRACKALLDEAKLRTSAHRATLAYREHLIPVLLERVLKTAMQRAVNDRHAR